MDVIGGVPHQIGLFSNSQVPSKVLHFIFEPLILNFATFPFPPHIIQLLMKLLASAVHHGAVIQELSLRILQLGDLQDQGIYEKRKSHTSKQSGELIDANMTLLSISVQNLVP